MWASNASLLKESGHAGGEGFEVAEILLDRVVDPAVIDLEIKVDEDVAEAHPSLQPFGEIPFEQSFLLENLDRVPVARRLGEALIGDHVLGDIEHGLAGEMEVSLRQVVKGRLADELLAGVSPERAELSQIAFQRAQATRQLSLIDH